MKKLILDPIGLCKVNGFNEYTVGSGVKVEGVLCDKNKLSNVRSKVTVLTAATKTLTADDSGSIFVLDLAAGIAITLPTAEVGLTYDFIVKTKVTGTHTITTYASNQTLVGNTVSFSITTADKSKSFTPGAAHYIMTMNGTTKGGDAGTKVKYTCISPFIWLVQGELIGTQGAAFVTPFS